MKRWIIIASVVVVIAALAYGFLALQTAKAPAEVEKVRSYTATYEDDFDDGVHTISGSVMAETPCQQVNAQASHIEGGGIRVDVTVTEPEGICLQRPTKLSFEAEVEAPEEAAVAVFVNGEPSR